MRICVVATVLMALFWGPLEGSANGMIARSLKLRNFHSVCLTLLNPHATMAMVLPHIEDDEALLMLKSHYSELLTWLSQKADATPEGANTIPKGDYGPKKN